MDKLATVLVISDALGETAASVALAAAGQFMKAPWLSNDCLAFKMHGR